MGEAAQREKGRRRQAEAEAGEEMQQAERNSKKWARMRLEKMCNRLWRRKRRGLSGMRAGGAGQVYESAET